MQLQEVEPDLRTGFPCVRPLARPEFGLQLSVRTRQSGILLHCILPAWTSFRSPGRLLVGLLILGRGLRQNKREASNRMGSPTYPFKRNYHSNHCIQFKRLSGHGVAREYEPVSATPQS